MKKIGILLALVVVLVSCGSATVSQKPKPTNKAMNVVLILTDDQGGHLSSLGTKGIATPNIDALAKEGVLFENAFAVVPSCSPSRSSINTGMFPHANGHWRNTITPKLTDADVMFTKQSKIVDRVGIHEYIETLPEILKKKGFYTGITQKFHMSPPWKFPYSVRNAVNNNPTEFKKFMNDFVNNAKGKPFFIQANISPPHRNFDHHMRKFPEYLPNINEIEVPEFLPDTPQMRKDLRKYYGCVQLADACVGAIVEQLKQKGVYENTLIIYTSDQGMAYHRAKASAYYAGLHVPFVAAGPNLLKNTQKKSLVSLIDVMPTILDFLHFPIPETVQGKSILPILKGKAEEVKDRSYVFGEHNSHGPSREEHYPSRMVFDGRYYYIRNLMPHKDYKLPDDLTKVKGWGNRSYSATLNAKDSHPLQYQLLKTLESGRPKEELYDIEKDKHQLYNLAEKKEQLQKLKELRNAMDKWRNETNDVVDDPKDIKTRKLVP